MSIVMNEFKFDVIEYLTKLRNVGVSEEVAAVQAQSLERAMDSVLEQSKHFVNNKELTIKRDMSLVTSNIPLLKSDMAVVKDDIILLRADVATLKTDMAVVKNDIGLIKGEIHKTELRLQKEIADLRYSALRMVAIWTGVGSSCVILSGMYTLLNLMLNK